MANMSYCRHENTAMDLAQVVARWEDFDPEQASKYELHGRAQIIKLVRELSDLIDEENN